MYVCRAASLTVSRACFLSISHAHAMCTRCTPSIILAEPRYIWFSHHTNNTCDSYLAYKPKQQVTKAKKYRSHRYSWNRTTKYTNELAKMMMWKMPGMCQMKMRYFFYCAEMRSRKSIIFQFLSVSLTFAFCFFVQSVFPVSSRRRWRVIIIVVPLKMILILYFFLNARTHTHTRARVRRTTQISRRMIYDSWHNEWLCWFWVSLHIKHQCRMAIIYAK